MLLTSHQVSFKGFLQEITAVKCLNFDGIFPLMHFLLVVFDFKPLADVRLDDHCSSYPPAFAIKSDTCLITVLSADVLSILTTTE